MILLEQIILERSVLINAMSSFQKQESDFFKETLMTGLTNHINK